MTADSKCGRSGRFPLSGHPPPRPPRCPHPPVSRSAARPARAGWSTPPRRPSRSASPSSSPPAGAPGAVLVQLPIIALAAVVLHALNRTAHGYDRALERERALRRAGAALVAASDRDAILAAGLAAVPELAGPHARAAITVADGQRVIVKGDAGPEPLRLPLRGREPQGVLAVTAPGGSTRTPAPRSRASPASSAWRSRRPASPPARPPRRRRVVPLDDRQRERRDHGARARRHDPLPVALDRGRDRLPRRGAGRHHRDRPHPPRRPRVGPRSTAASSAARPVGPHAARPLAPPRRRLPPRREQALEPARRPGVGGVVVRTRAT